MEVADPPSGWRCFECVGNRRAGGANRIVIERAGRAGIVEEREKLFATLVVMFPRIFSVKNDGDGLLSNGSTFPREMTPRRLGQSGFLRPKTKC